MSLARIQPQQKSRAGALTAQAGSASASTGNRPIRVAVDIGGTFTDIVLATADGRFVPLKISTTPVDPSDAVIEGLAQLLADNGVAPETVTDVVHGTTVGSNTILQKTGARTGLLTTRGFRDVLEIARIRTPTMFDLSWVKPEPLVERRFRLEVSGRIAADGSVVEPLDRAGVLAAGETFRRNGIEAVAVCFINSYVNPAHEQEAASVLADAYPDLLVTASCTVLPEIKEYERTSTTVVNAYLLPAMRTYVARLQERLRTLGLDAPLLVMASNGGIMSAEATCTKPVFAVASGPAGGVAGASRLGAAQQVEDLIVFDLGGTTAKACIIENGQPLLTTEYEFREGISTPSRFVKGGGYMLKVPSIDIAEVGAGGGSIAFIDEGGLLQVGPQSAGADPGPACYGRGNDRPTVTDANVVLGYLNPGGLAGGSLPIDPQKAADAIERFIARPLGISVSEAAFGVREVANVAMARAIRAVTVERGRDPRGMTMMAFGGGGPLHAADVARHLGIGRVIVPALSGVFAALGMLTADIEHNLVRTATGILGDDTPSLLEPGLRDLAGQARAILAGEGHRPEDMEIRLFLDLRYRKQSSELTVPFGRAAASGGLAFGDAIVTEARRAFEAEYRRMYGYVSDEPLEIANLRCTARAKLVHRTTLDRISVDQRFTRGKADTGGTEDTTGSATRQAFFSRQKDSVAVPIMARGALATARPGPLIAESYDTTILVPPDARVSADASGNVLIDLAAEGASA